LRTALDAGRMNAYEWDAGTDLVVRIGDPHGFPLVGTGSEWFDLVHPEDREELRAMIGTLRPESPGFVLEYRIVDGKGVRWLQDSARAAFDADGKFLSLRGVVADVTARREAEARLTLIASVSELIGSSEDPSDFLYEISRSVGEHLRARRCLFTEIDLENNRGIIRRDYCRGVASVAGVYKVSDYPEATLSEMRAGRMVVNCDAKHDPRTAHDYEKIYEPHGERAYVAVPLLRDGRWVAELWIADDVPRQWTTHDLDLLRGVAERTWSAVEKLRVNNALRESEARMQFVGERGGVGYWDWDIVRDEIFWSSTCHLLHRIPEGEPLTYARYLEALHPDDRALLDRGVRSALERGGPSEYEVECRTVWPDGTVRWIHGKGSASFEDGKPVRMAGIAIDVTARKTLELEREELLARERHLRAEADEANRTKDDFLALISHELRTPMATILGWASFIRSGMADPATAEKGMAAIERASQTQSRLIDDLLDVSRIVSGRMTLDHERVDVTEPVLGAIEMIQPAAHASSIALVPDLGDAPAFVIGDATRLQQVVGNLLLNAVKFSPTGGEVRVSIVQTRDAIEIQVRDRGVGIHPNFLPHVFDRFRQADDGPTRRFGGLGLGLSIVRHLTELHGGSVSAESDGPGRGARFTVRLPRALPAPAIVPAFDPGVQIDSHALDGVHVLLVDDDPSAREVIGTILTTFGATVTLAASAAEAAQRFSSSRVDVLVSDIGLPDEDGYALLRRLRAGSSAPVPAIAVTAYAEPRHREHAIAAGFQAYLAKPVEARAVAGAVLRVVGR
jgi:signal transduction histidine kinase